MRIGELADRTGVSPRLLRYYEQQGLLRPARLGNGYREYREADVTAVRRIRALLDAGLPTSVIAVVLDCVHEDGGTLMPRPCPGMVTHLRREQARVTDTITRLQASQRTLDAWLSSLSSL
ncbi:MerR family transcriptional regulator [Actinomadura graeca]|uniref:MerR family transcriptional regulator n=1 Tax=Actinomadura graeca TaxID=2750812 RepID=A0ABX8R3J1_9ACTN|nr:MerR family transcriptional regulator [Actinomadura graeca]QXJ25136.1 MerR family transcriptional regulator [Actinomadura graeca]